MASFVVLDLETIPDPRLPPWDKEEFPPAPYHQVVVAGILVLKDGAVAKLDVVQGDDEATILRNLTGGISRMRGVTVCGWNSRGFDLPVVVARCLAHGIPWPWYYQTKGARYRFSDDGHLDVKDALSDFGAGRPSSLDTVARSIGLPGKIGGLDGSHVAERIAAGELPAVQAYCLQDVVQTAAVLLRYWLVSGVTTEDGYTHAMGLLLDAAQADERTRPVVDACDRARLLLTRAAEAAE